MNPLCKFEPPFKKSWIRPWYTHVHDVVLVNTVYTVNYVSSYIAHSCLEIFLSVCFINNVCVHRLHQLWLCIGCALTQNEVKADTLRGSVPFINDNSLQVPDIITLLGSLALTFPNMFARKTRAMNKNNVDGTDSPLNKITWISCRSYCGMTSLSFVKARQMNFLLKHDFEREFKFLRLSILILSN